MCRNFEPSNVYNLWLWGSGPYLKRRLALCSWKASCDPWPGTRSWQLKLVISLVRLLLIDGPESFQMLLIASVIPFGVRFSLQSPETAIMMNVCCETQLLHQWNESIMSNSISFTWIHLDRKHPLEDTTDLLVYRSSLKPEIDVFNWLTCMNKCFFPSSSSYLNFIIKSRSHRRAESEALINQIISVDRRQNVEGQTRQLKNYTLLCPFF